MIQVSTKITKSGKEVTTAMFSNGRRLRVGAQGLTLGTSRMARLGYLGEKVIKDRTAEGIGSDDLPMKPLANRYRSYTKDGRTVYRLSGYAARKSRKGLQPKRDLRGLGIDGTHLMDGKWVRYADDRMVRLDITRRIDRIKARSNEQRSPWFGWSNNDIRVLRVEARKLFGQVVQEIELVPTNEKRRQLLNLAHPWMDPLGRRSALTVAS